MRYYLDCEFNGFGGQLLSLALIREDGEPLYLLNTDMELKPRGHLIPWVAENVMPILRSIPDGVMAAYVGQYHFAGFIASYLRGDPDPVIITDWPDDIKYFCQCVITGPGQMINIPGLKFEMHRVDAYPTDLPGAIQHNAFWDAMALRHKLTGAK